MITVALLLSGRFESVYKKFDLNQDSYLKTYRNDWSWEYVSGLRREGLKPIIYITSSNYCGIHQTDDGYFVRFLQFKPSYRWLSKIRFPPKRHKIGNYLQDYINFSSFKDSLKSALQDDKVDLFYTQEYWSARFDFLAQDVDIPFIGADHGANDSRSIKYFKQKSLPKAYKLTCQSVEEVEKVNSYGGNAVLMPNGVDVDFYCPEDTKTSVASKVKTILTVAKLSEKQKRTSDLIRALQYLDPEWTLDIVGTGKDLSLLQNLASELNLEQRVRFLGFIKDKAKLREKYRECAVFALPSASEAVAYVALEAMSCGSAVVTSDIKTFRGLISQGKNGLRVPVGDCKALAQGIVDCYNNRLLYGSKARDTIVSCYSQQKLFSELAKVIRLGCNN